MKKTCLLLVLALLATLLGSVPAALAEKEPVTITFMGWEASPLETESVLNGIALFESKNPDIKVEYTPINGTYAEKLLTMIAGDAAPDTFFMGMGEYRNFQEKGVLLDLTDYFNAEYKLDDFIPSSQKLMSIDDHIYGVSSCTVSPAIYYNKDIFDAAGVAYPPADPAEAWTWDEFVEVAKKLTKTNADGTVDTFGVYGAENSDPRMALYYAAGGTYYNDDITEAAVDNEIFRTVMGNILKLRNEYKVAPQASLLMEQGSSGMSGAQMLQTGKIAMLLDGSWAMQELASLGFRVGVGCLPKMGDSAVASTIGQAHVHSAWAKTTHPEEAWRFLSFLSSAEYQTDLVRSGLWMPNRTAMYEPENIDSWYNKDVYGEGYEKMVRFFRDAAPYQTGLCNKVKANQAINDELNLYFSAEGQDIELTIQNITDNVAAELRRR